MRCSKCNKWLPMLTKFCQKCGKEVPPENRKKSRIQLLSIVAVSLLLGVIASFYVYYNPQDLDEDQIMGAAVVSGILVVIFSFNILFFVIGCIKFFIRRPVVSAVTGGLILLIVCGGYFVHWLYGFDEQFIADVAIIQDELNEAAAAKIMGDAIMANKTIPGSSMARIKSAAELAANRLEFMPVPKKLSDYRESAKEWSESIAKAAEDTKTWSSVSSLPRGFQLKLSQKQSEKLFEDSVKKITELKEFGDSAITRKDRMTMLYIAAKLLVQEHWLDSILYSENAGLLSFNGSFLTAWASNRDIMYVPPVVGTDVTCRVCDDPNVRWTAAQRNQYGCDTRCHPSQQQNQQQQNQQQQNAGGQNQNKTGGNQTGSGSNVNQPPHRTVCLGRGGISVGKTATNVYCIEDVIALTYGINGSAIDIAEGSTTAKNGWNSNWHELEGLGVISVGEPVIGVIEHSPTVQAFYDDCQVKGGIVGGSGTVKAGLPTTESGYTCEYKYYTLRNGEQPCWDFLTYSGGRYMGGNTGCPVENLLPTTFDQKRVKALGSEWDGLYDAPGGSVQCAGDFAYTVPVPAAKAAPVSNNIMMVAVGPTLIPVPIKGDTAVWSMSISTQEGSAVVSISEIDTFKFYHSGNTIGVNAIYNGTITVSAAGQVKVSTCHGNVVGARR